MVHDAERVANDVMGLSDIARRLCEVAGDKVNLGIISGLAPSVLPKMFDNKRLPENIRLEVRTAPIRVIVDEIYQGCLDIGFAIEVDRDLIPSRLVSTRLFDGETVLITPPGYPLEANGVR